MLQEAFAWNMGIVEIVVTAMWIMLPAYVPNNAAVIVGGGRPIDAGQTFRGNRLLGDGKTWRGLIGGVAAGLLVALGLNALHSHITIFSLPTFPVAVVLSLPIGALLGDILASFFKRRLGRERGSSFPLLDQFDLVFGSLGLTALVSWSWLVAEVTWPIFLAIVIITPILHVLTNVIAYGVGLKDVPW